MNLLFTCAGRRVELVNCFKAAAQKLFIDYCIHGTDISETSSALQFCDKKHIVPRIDDPSYIDTLFDICKAENIDIVIPTIDTDLLLLSENKERFSKIGTFIMVSKPDIVASCCNKMLTQKLFKSSGLEFPPVSNDVKTYPGGYPAVIKPSNGSGSSNVFKAESKEMLEFLAGSIKNYIIQPYIGGTEYSVDVMCDFEGNPIYITPRVRLQTRAGEVSKSKIAQDDKIIEEVKRLISVMKPCGPATVQLIREKDTGIDYYIEINPRFGGGAPLSMYAGAGSAEAVLRLMNGEKLKEKPYAARDGELYTRYDMSIRVNQ